MSFYVTSNKKPASHSGYFSECSVFTHESHEQFFDRFELRTPEEALEFELSLREGRQGKPPRFGKSALVLSASEAEEARRATRGELKKFAGWYVPGTFTGQSRRARDADSVTALAFDIEGGGADEFADRLKLALEGDGVDDAPLEGVAALMHTTAKHSPDAPRWRAIFPLADPLKGDPRELKFRKAFLSKVLAGLVWGEDGPIRGLDACSVDGDPARLFYFPVFTEDRRDLYNLRRYDGEPMSVEWLEERAAELGMDQDDPDTWPSFAGAPRDDGASADPSAKVSDPRASSTIVGQWARFVETVERLFDEILVDEDGPVYVFDEAHGRYRYRGTEGNAGVLLHDDPPCEGGHLYATSQHMNHDPTAGMTLNVWDLARIHWFGDLDAGHDDARRKLPSEEAMREWLSTGYLPEWGLHLDTAHMERVRDDFLAHALLGKRTAADAFTDEDVGSLPEDVTEAMALALDGGFTVDLSTLPPNAKDIMRRLDKAQTKDGVKAPYVDRNVDLILENDPLFKVLAMRLTPGNRPVLLPTVTDGGEVVRWSTLKRALGMEMASSDPKRSFGYSDDPKADLAMLFYRRAKYYGLLPKDAPKQKVGNLVHDYVLRDTRSPSDILAGLLLHRAEKLDAPPMTRDEIEDLMCEVLCLDPSSATDRMKGWLAVASALSRVLPDAKYGVPSQQMHALVLKGPQGCGKSEFTRLLGMRPEADELRELLDATFPLRVDMHRELSSEDVIAGRGADSDRRLAESVAGALVVEIPEADKVVPHVGGSAIKDFLSRSVVHFRPAYSRTTRAENLTHATYMTMNMGGLLDDPTGARRFVLVSLPNSLAGGGQLPLRKLAERLWDVYVSIAWMFNRDEQSVFSVPSDIARSIASEAASLLTTVSPAREAAEKAAGWLQLPCGVPLERVHPGPLKGFDAEIAVRPRGLASQARSRLLAAGQPGGRPPRDAYAHLEALLETRLGWQTHDLVEIRYPGGWLETDYLLASPDFWEEYEAAKRAGTPWDPDEVYRNLYVEVEALTEEDVL